MKVRRISLVAALMLLLWAVRLTAQPAPRFGVDTLSTLVIGAYEMETVDTPLATAAVGIFQRTLKASGSVFAEVHLPQGAQIVALELEGCDTSAAGGVGALLFWVESADYQLFGSVGTGSPATPGCSKFGNAVETLETVDNRTRRYVLQVDNFPFDGTTSFGAVRIFYRLQVSPAPPSQSFNDVPSTDPAYQFIEALAASGITAGCGGGNFCPNAPLTRRQMAVFLSKALGLQWPDGPEF